MATHRSVATPAALVGALGGIVSGKRHKRRGRFRMGRRRRQPVLDIAGAKDVAHRVGGLVPTGRRRKRLVRRVRRMTRHLDRVSDVANGAATIVGIAAAGSELLSTLRARDTDDDSVDAQRGWRDSGDADLEDEVEEDALDEDEVDDEVDEDDEEVDPDDEDEDEDDVEDEDEDDVEDEDEDDVEVEDEDDVEDEDEEAEEELEDAR
jgi:hypothetical protein